MINKLHLIYGLIIAGVILCAVVICWILSANNEVSSAALQNFTFAATIASIVLAVVSITYSIYSGAGMSGSVSVMQSAEEEIRKQVTALQNIDDRIMSAVKEGNLSLAEKVDAVTQQIQPLQYASLQATSTINNHAIIYDVEHTSLLGMLTIYSCLKWKEIHKNWPLDILGNENRLYIYGYLVAMSSFPSLKFSLKIEEMSNMVEDCNFADGGLSITKGQLLSYIKNKAKNKETYEKYLKIIDDYFAKES